MLHAQIDLEDGTNQRAALKWAITTLAESPLPDGLAADSDLDKYNRYEAL